MNFSISSRGEMVTAASSGVFDLVVIGGGITGCGIALDAASRGLSVVLLEQLDFAYGTSSRSTKLVHGGLRYLKQLEFGLVAEVGRERAILHSLAPHLVVPEKMLLPFSGKSWFERRYISFGLGMYDFLAGVQGDDRKKMLSASETIKAEPLLKGEIDGGALYAEYRTDDARLTIEIAKRAFSFGAIMINYARVDDFILADGEVSGVVVRDTFTNRGFEVRGKAVVNAAGPWVDDLRKKEGALNGKSLKLSKGVHIVVDRKKIPVRQASYFDVGDGRMVFVIPRGRATYIGTTDTFYEGRKEDVSATSEDATYLLDAVNRVFPQAGIGMHDVESSWAGLRPLIYKEGKSASELSRKDEIFTSPQGLISIAGGKLTGYRKMAERVVDLVVSRFFDKVTLKPCQTHAIPLVTPSFSNREEVTKFQKELAHMLEQKGIDETTTASLVQNFGLQALRIKEIFDALPNAGAELSLLNAQLQFCLESEMTATLEDFIVRRTGLLYFDIAKVTNYADELCVYMATYLGWSTERRVREMDNLQSLMRDAKLRS